MPSLLAERQALPFEMQVRLRHRRNQEFTCNGVGVGVDKACAFLQRSLHEFTSLRCRFYNRFQRHSHILCFTRKASCELSIKPTYAWCEPPPWHPYEPVGPSAVPHV
eukprot:3499590-Pleurochrysis_carterae.AAC.2